MKQNVVEPKSIDFAIRIIRVYQSLQNESKEYVMSKQLLRSGTAVGALIREAEHAESRRDFLHKMNIALKECNETDYWLMLLYKSEYLEEPKYQSLTNDCRELIRLLSSIVKTLKDSL